MSSNALKESRMRWTASFATNQYLTIIVEITTCRRGVIRTMTDQLKIRRSFTRTSAFGAAAFASQLPAIRREVRPIYFRRGILPTLDSLQAVDTVVEESERQTITPTPVP